MFPNWPGNPQRGSIPNPATEEVIPFPLWAEKMNKKIYNLSHDLWEHRVNHGVCETFDRNPARSEPSSMSKSKFAAALGVTVGTKELPIKIKDLPNKIFHNRSIKYCFHLLGSSLEFKNFKSAERFSTIRQYSLIKWAWGNIVTVKNERNDKLYAQHYDFDGCSYKSFSVRNFAWYKDRCIHVYVQL